MKSITIEEAADLLGKHKVAGIKTIKCVNQVFHNNIWTLDGIALTNGQYVGLAAEGDCVQYWLVEPEDIKE